MGTTFLGIDVGSSFVKTTIFDAESGVCIGEASFPGSEQKIETPHPGWAEQDPETWWDHFKKGYARILRTCDIDTRRIGGIGITYQMHGLVLVDDKQKVLRRSIIWCDSRAVDIGQRAFTDIGESACLRSLLNSPGNFTASRLRWVQENEPETYERIHRIMLPGDFIAMKLTGEITTTAGGLSEGMFWDFERQSVSNELMEYFGFDPSLIPDLVPAIGKQGRISGAVADELGLSHSVNITYRAGDQPNNAFSLRASEPGQIVATAGTSGVIYAVTDDNVHDPGCRVNTFLHVNNTPLNPRNGILACVNGTGILYRWLKRLLAASSYDEMNKLAERMPLGSEGLLFYPFGNGAERILNNRQPAASVLNLDFNRHSQAHFLRSGLEGICFALNMGLEVIKSMSIPVQSITAGNSNLFLSRPFREIFAHVTQVPLCVFETSGAEGAARSAALGAGFYDRAQQAFESLKQIEQIDPDAKKMARYADAFQNWKMNLQKLL